VSLVLDTHPLVWHLAGAKRKLSRRARRVFEDAERGRLTVYVPTVVLMEIVLLEHLGRVKVSWADLLEQIRVRTSYTIEPLTTDDVGEARSLGVLADPFDRMIAGTALRLGLPLLTRDRKIGEATSVKTVW
jgi:PIN domain nuclease of toxin-antitoxin system